MTGLETWLRSTLPGLGETGPIGVDFSAQQVHFSQFDVVEGQPRLRHARSVAYAGDVANLLASRDALKRVVSEALQDRGFKGRCIVTDVPAIDLRLMVLNYKLDTADAEPETILSLARERMKGELDDYVVDYAPIRTSGHQQGDHSALVAIAPEDKVIEHLERLRAARLEVSALEIAPVAIRRLVAWAATGEQNRVALIIRMGERTTELTLLSGRRLLLYRAVEVGMETIATEAAKALDCEPEAARDLLGLYGVGHASDADLRVPELADSAFGLDGSDDIVSTLREILRPRLRGLVEQAHKAVSYAAFQTRGMSIEGVYLIEGSTACPGLDVLLAEMLQLPVETFRPSTAVPGFDQVFRKGDGHRFAASLGFALRGLVDV